MSEGNLKVQKIQKSSRIALKAARAVKVILIVAAVLALSTGAMMIAFQGGGEGSVKGGFHPGGDYAQVRGQCRL